MVFNLFKNEDDVFLVLDVGTNSLKSVLFQKIPEAKKEKIVVLASSVNYFEKPRGILSQDQELDVVKKAISETIELLKRNASFSKADLLVKKRVKKGKIPVLLFLSPAKLKARTFYQNFTRKNSKNKISIREEDEISKELFKKAKESIAADFAEDSKITAENISWIYSGIICKKIDGYLVPKLEGYEGREIEFKVLAVFSFNSYLENIKEAVKNLRMNFLKVIHLSEVLTRLFYKEQDKDIAFIDIGCNTTQFFLVKNRNLQEIGEIEIGGGLFTRLLAEQLGLDEKSAEILKEKYSKGLLTPEAQKKIKELFVAGQKKWYSELRRKIQETAKKEPISFNIYIFGGGGLLPEIKEIIEKEREAYSEETALPFLNKVEIICPKDLEWIKNLPQDLESSQLVPALLICSSVL